MSKKYSTIFPLMMALSLLLANTLFAQLADYPDDEREGIKINYTEANVGTYTLPDPLELLNGKKVTDAKTWFEKRRPEILRLFEENEYGRPVGDPKDVSFEKFDAGTPAFEGKVLRKQVTIRFAKENPEPSADVLIYLPADAAKPSPLLLHIGFMANCATVDDPGVKAGEIWNREKQKVPTDCKSAFGKIDVLQFINRGYGFATIYYGDIDPDFSGGLPYGIRAFYLKTGQTEPAADEWGAISAWAWGLSRVMDYFEQDEDIDAGRIAVTGVSRLGKTALWTAARDQRFAMAIPSCSGEGGAALSRRNYGETIKLITLPQRYGYQFCANYSKWSDDPSSNPVDAHMLIALMAPRPVLLQTGDTDKWSDPKGEFLAAVAAEPVYHLLGKKGLETDKIPQSGVPILNDIGFYMHKGGHGMHAVDGTSDWEVYLRFMDIYLKP
ncbi:acetylxylan esterase [candidate division KSB1 bacterium]|nr:acetylxylan esterase [candidate division KSB1 bacterium]